MLFTQTVSAPPSHAVTEVSGARYHFLFFLSSQFALKQSKAGILWLTHLGVQGPTGRRAGALPSSSLAGARGGGNSENGQGGGSRPQIGVRLRRQRNGGAPAPRGCAAASRGGAGARSRMPGTPPCYLLQPRVTLHFHHDKTFSYKKNSRRNGFLHSRW